MRYVLRADATQSTGSGHVMRSTAIAEELITRGEEVIFVGAFSEVPWLASRINGLGFSRVAHSPEEFISDPAADVLILDSYLVPVDEEFIQQKNWKRVVTIIDDLTPEYRSDLKIHPGLSNDWIQITNTRVLAGPRYIPFRKSIEKNRSVITEHLELQILIIGGGTDTFNFVRAVAEVLREIDDDFHVRIFTGSDFLDKLDSRFTSNPIGSDLDLFASTAELVFTTASTTSLEFIAREVPVGIGCAVDNQQEYYDALSAAGVAWPIGRMIQGCWELDELKIIELVRSKECREALRKKCADLIDLKGAKRIVDELLKL
jgi:spore coat polysaccharide biosynthesis predicted glycosyltransferase SpsG